MSRSIRSTSSSNNSKLVYSRKNFTSQFQQLDDIMNEGTKEELQAEINKLFGSDKKTLQHIIPKKKNAYNEDTGRYEIRKYIDEIVFQKKYRTLDLTKKDFYPKSFTNKNKYRSLRKLSPIPESIGGKRTRKARFSK